MITSYLHLSPEVAKVQDNIGITGLHTLGSRPYSFDDADSTIRAYLSHSEVKKAVLMTDGKGKSTPLNYLYRNKNFDDLLYLEIKKSCGLDGMVV